MMNRLLEVIDTACVCLLLGLYAAVVLMLVGVLLFAVA